MLQSMGSRRVRHDWVNWTDGLWDLSSPIRVWSQALGSETWVLTTGPSGNSLCYLFDKHTWNPSVSVQPKALPDSGRPSIKAKKCFSKSPKPENGRLDQTAAAIRGHLSMTFPNTSTNSPKSMELTFSMSMACAPVAVARLGSPWVSDWHVSARRVIFAECTGLGFFFFFFFATPAWHVLNASGKSRDPEFLCNQPTQA